MSAHPTTGTPFCAEGLGDPPGPDEVIDTRPWITIEGAMYSYSVGTRCDVEVPGVGYRRGVVAGLGAVDTRGTRNTQYVHVEVALSKADALRLARYQWSRAEWHRRMERESATEIYMDGIEYPDHLSLPADA